MFVVSLLVALSVNLAVGDDDWKPPKNPDLMKILQSAQRDTQNGEFERALAKHVWYHQNALSIDSAHYGVRLSFALMYWQELATKYPEAETKLREFRDAARTEILAKSTRNAGPMFHDFAAINRTIGEQKETIKLFKKLDSDNPEVAKQAFDAAKENLITAGEFELVKKYFDGKKEAEQLILLVGNHEDAEPMAARFYRKQAVALIETLIKIEQKDIAEEIKDELSKAFDDEGLDRKINKLLKATKD